MGDFVDFRIFFVFPNFKGVFVFCATPGKSQTHIILSRALGVKTGGWVPKWAISGPVSKF